MGRNKQAKFDKFRQFENTAEYVDSNSLAKLKEFTADEKVTLELACGKGHYTVGLAKLFPNRKFVGIDIQGERLFYGARLAVQSELTNAFFFRTQIEDLEKYFRPDSVEEIWITFPDPFPKDRHAKRRLVSPRFLELYKKVLISRGKVNLKTDNDDLYRYAKEQIEILGYNIIDDVWDLYQKDDLSDEEVIKTDFESKFLKQGEKIHLLKFEIS